jgi:sporulation protein YlmC with PRC-barrel domain
VDGRKLAELYDVAVDPDQMRVAALIISQGGLLNRETRSLPADAVQVWGRDVILVNGSEADFRGRQVADRDKWPLVLDHLKGCYVVSTDGRRVGQIDDLLIDTKGNVVGYVLSQVFIEGPLAKSKRLDARQTRTLGPDVVIIDVTDQPVADQSATVSDTTHNPIADEDTEESRGKDQR